MQEVDRLKEMFNKLKQKDYLMPKEGMNKTKLEKLYSEISQQIDKVHVSIEKYKNIRELLDELRTLEIESYNIETKKFNLDKRKNEIISRLNGD